MAGVRRYTYNVENTTLGGQDIINLDPFKLVFNVAVLVDVVSGAVNYTIEFTHDELDTLSDIRWLTDPAFPTSETATGVFAITTPVTAIRLNLGALSGEVRLSVIQGIDR
jgi:hypothetical protein